MPNKINIELTQVPATLTGPTKPTGLYLIELRSRAWKEKEARRKRQASDALSAVKEPVPSAKKKVGA